MTDLQDMILERKEWTQLLNEELYN